MREIYAEIKYIPITEEEIKDGIPYMDIITKDGQKVRCKAIQLMGGGGGGGSIATNKTRTTE